MMTDKKEKTAGILGGMGPEATVDLMQRIIRLTPAMDDKDHVRCIVDNNPKVPSRIKAIIDGSGKDPGPCMADMAQRLEKCGADFLAIACNTAHFYYDIVSRSVNVPVINMIALVTDHVRHNFPDHTKIGILASPAVAKTKLYTHQFKKYGIDEVWPDAEYQDQLFTIIKKIKTGDTAPRVCHAYSSVCKNLVSKGADTAVVGCTELSVLSQDLPLKTIDAAELLAQKIVQTAKQETMNPES